MYRTEIYLTDDQRTKLQDIAYLLTKKEGKRIGMAAVVRQAIDDWLKKNLKKFDETDLVLDSTVLMSGIKSAQSDLKKGALLSRKDVFGS